MQTFLPYPDFSKSAHCLDMKRLGKQRVEVLQILKSLKEGGGWQNHPAVKMWKGYEEALVLYGEVICDVWTEKGYKDTCLDKIYKIVGVSGLMLPRFLPPWLGNKNFHRSHKSNLLRKDPEFYGKYGWDVPADLPYVWPV